MKRKEFVRNVSGALGAGIFYFSGLHHLWENHSSKVRPRPSKIPKTDAHMHLFDLESFSYPWLKNFPEINQSFLINDYHRSVKKSNVTKAIFIESGVDVKNREAEIEQIVKLAESESRILGIVAKCDIAAPSVFQRKLEKITSFSPELVKGIRGKINQFVIDSPDFISNMNELSDRGLSFDLLIRPGIFMNMAKVIDKTPNTIFIINHLGFPNIEKGELDFWQKGIQELAKRPNVNCKISGMLTQAGDNWNLEMMRPFLDVLLESFGFDRLLYGSDWPSILRVDSLRAWSKAFNKLTHSLSETEQHKLFHLNADRIYRL